MFLSKLKKNNPALLDYAFYAHQNGLILPDTYLLDLDTITENAIAIKNAADVYHFRLYFMLKQIGRNPLVARRLMEIGYDGAVCVDFIEALTMMENDVHLGNIGHLVQIPKTVIPKLLKAKPDFITVYSMEKIYEIEEAAGKLDMVQPILIRVTDSDSELYSGQIAGFHSSQLSDVLSVIDKLEHVSFGGFTVFPGLLFNEKTAKIEPTVNMNAMKRANALAKIGGLSDFLINIPSANCSASMPLVHKLGGNSVEPGHGLTGTTPLHAVTDQPERVGYVYVSEISHNYENKAYCYGGGHYRRGHMKNALVGKNMESAIMADVTAPNMDSIDYHYELNQNFQIGDTVAMCYRTQIFVTRSRVAVVEGLRKGQPIIRGIYDHLGRELKD